jgi:hypothetical protein
MSVLDGSIIQLQFCGCGTTGGRVFSRARWPDMLMTSQLKMLSRTAGGTYSCAPSASATYTAESMQARKGEGQRLRRQTMTVTAQATAKAGGRQAP